MIAREFTYTADRFDADVETQMATLEWFTTNANGSYKHHSLRMPHDGISAGVNRALDVMPGRLPRYQSDGSTSDLSEWTLLRAVRYRCQC